MGRMLTGLIIMAAVFVGAITKHSTPSSFIDPLSLVFVLGVVASGAVLSFPGQQLLEALVPGRAQTPEAMERKAAVLHRMADLAISGGIAGTMIGLVLMLQNLDEPTQIGPAMAVALLTLLYGVVLGELVFRGIVPSASAPPNITASATGRRGAVSIYMPLLGLFCILTTFFVMLLAMADFA